MVLISEFAGNSTAALPVTAFILSLLENIIDSINAKEFPNGRKKRIKKKLDDIFLKGRLLDDIRIFTVKTANLHSLSTHILEELSQLLTASG